MSKIRTLSLFYYGHKVDSTNFNLDFDEGNGELTAELSIGDYTLEEFALEIAGQMSAVGTQSYLATVTRGLVPVINIQAPGDFTILCRTGSHFGTSGWGLAGFTGLDKSGDNFYTGPSQSGSVYRPQYPFHNYTAPEDFQVLENAAVSTSAKGDVQVISFGEGRRMEMDMRIITNKVGLRLDPFYENPTGVTDARAFLKYLISRARVEFMPDYENVSNYFKVQLETTETERDGTGFKLKSMGVPDFYQTGKLFFREVPE
jgi:hypothetical protein